MAKQTLIACIGILIVFFAGGTPARGADVARVAGGSFATEQSAVQASGWKAEWKLSEIRPASISNEGTEAIIEGTGDRNNPLRRELAEPFRESRLFVRFSLRYDPPEDEGEFFVMWLDRLDGGDEAVHSENVPNIGVHVATTGPKKGQTVFMVRIGAAKTAWSEVELQRGRTYSVVGLLSKSETNERADFDRFDLWVDPEAGDLETPDATIRHPQSVNFIRWVGFASGRKTEVGDRIFVNDVVLSRTWEDVLKREETSLTGEAPPLPSAADFGWTGPVDFRKDVYPLLQKRCFECHEGEKSESGHRLDVRNEILGYSTGDPLAQPGKAAESRIIEHVRSPIPEERMPPVENGEGLTEKEIGLLWAWIDQGLAWDETLLPQPLSTSDHWAFQEIKRPTTPRVNREEWVRSPVDAFIAEKQESSGVRPAEEAAAGALVRRLYLDLTGLPPTPDEVTAFVSDQSPDAYGRLVDRLLDSPHYGEHWARYWLDLSRWGESHGYQHDIPRPYAWRYRDYLISSFNADKPYDRFITEQLAGDELRPYSDENLVATGFLAAARISGNDMDKAAQRNDVLVDIVNATSSAILGLTMECAQCHNHKFDPLSQRDYYRMQAFFVNGQLGNLSLREAGSPNPTDFEKWVSKGAYTFYMSEAKKLVAKKRFEHTKQAHTWGFHSPATSDPDI